MNRIFEKILSAFRGKENNETPGNETGAVTRNSWRVQAMPKERKTFILDRILSDKEIAFLRRGYKPKEAEDKWFWFAEGNTLYIHRSCTGFCIYEIDLSDNRIHSVTVNNNPGQHACRDGITEISELNNLLDWWLDPDGYDFYGKWLEENKW